MACKKPWHQVNYFGAMAYNLIGNFVPIKWYIILLISVLLKKLLDSVNRVKKLAD